ncbi:GWxTD domain-containing protein [Cryomorpha ignava]|uniref:GWxTD domain-containing protein n=1 Tax=Cryomorpha ignava TaxID=101383 RepID=A0A7K3WTW4_9FLAO|nr:GWxTD domain-containing protein [Cryomorpha ignava]NEN24481.1 GWxTD domain-containing protein [Cryomorpha ignava]
MKEALKKISISLLLVFAMVLSANASPLAVFNYKVFYVPDRGTVVETYFDISGSSVVLKDMGDGVLKSQVQLTLIFKKGDEIITFDKKVIDSPDMSADAIVDFIDVERFVLPSGTYDLEIQISDMFDPADTPQSSHLKLIVPSPPASGVFISDIELVSAYKNTESPGVYSKSGYDIIPMVNDDELRAGMNELVFYAEIYSATDDIVGDKFLVRAYIADTANGVPVPYTVVNLRRNAGEVTPVLSRIPITDLPAGKYDIVIEVISKENKPLAMQKLQVQRSVPEKAADVDSFTDDQIAMSWINKYDQKMLLYEYFKSLRPISTASELYAMNNSMSDVSKIELKYLQRYFYAFWDLRGKENSEKAWLDYKAKVDIAQKQFGTTNKRGYETDQGRIFLKYDAPNDIVDRANESSSYPYIIWHYYKAGKFNNVKFVFYDPMLLGQDYELLHSENIPGETNNYRWKMMLQQRDTPQNNVDRTSPNDEYGGRIDDYFNNPR